MGLNLYLPMLAFSVPTIISYIGTNDILEKTKLQKKRQIDVRSINLKNIINESTNIRNKINEEKYIENLTKIQNEEINNNFGTNSDSEFNINQDDDIEILDYNQNTQDSENYSENNDSENYSENNDSENYSENNDPEIFTLNNNEINSEIFSENDSEIYIDNDSEVEIININDPQYDLHQINNILKSDNNNLRKILINKLLRLL